MSDLRDSLLTSLSSHPQHRSSWTAAKDRKLPPPEEPPYLRAPHSHLLSIAASQAAPPISFYSQDSYVTHLSQVSSTTLNMTHQWALFSNFAVPPLGLNLVFHVRRSWRPARSAHPVLSQHQVNQEHCMSINSRRAGAHPAYTTRTLFLH